MKKLFINPEINTAELAAEDVIMASKSIAEARKLMKLVDNSGWNEDGLNGIWQGGDWI